MNNHISFLFTRKTISVIEATLLTLVLEWRWEWAETRSASAPRNHYSEVAVHWPTINQTATTQTFAVNLELLPQHDVTYSKWSESVNDHEFWGLLKNEVMSLSPTLCYTSFFRTELFGVWDYSLMKMFCRIVGSHPSTH